MHFLEIMYYTHDSVQVFTLKPPISFLLQYLWSQNEYYCRKCD